MSATSGRKFLSQAILGRYLSSNANSVIVENYRDKLDSLPVIMGIGYEDLLPNKQVSRADFENAYTEFLNVAIMGFFNRNVRRTYATLEAYSADTSTNRDTRGVLLIRSPVALLAKDFASIRRFITDNVSSSIPSNKYFGTSVRQVHFTELGSTLEEANESQEAQEIRAKYKRNNAETVDLTSIFDKKGYLIGPNGKRLLVNRSLVDIGHLAYSSTSTPLIAKLDSIVTSGAFSSSVTQAALASINKIKEVHAEIAFSFKNTSTTSIKAEGRLSLTLHHYKLNSKLSVLEADAYRKVMNEIGKEVFSTNLLSIPGSNTLAQDAMELIGMRYSGKPGSLKAHSAATGSVSVKTNVKPKPVTLVKGKGIAKAPVPLAKSKNTSLAALQILLDKHLQDVISANMGDQGYPGGQRKILNYRTGRFAASAKVARLSQSRQGMITAFYTYMKNPYQTFEPGYRQGSPKTRDPKLLISASIREIAATLVGNRLRAVAV